MTLAFAFKHQVACNIHTMHKARLCIQASSCLQHSQCAQSPSLHSRIKLHATFTLCAKPDVAFKRQGGKMLRHLYPTFFGPPGINFCSQTHQTGILHPMCVHGHRFAKVCAGMQPPPAKACRTMSFIFVQKDLFMVFFPSELHTRKVCVLWHAQRTCCQA
jgi:hypothetical protein